MKKIYCKFENKDFMLIKNVIEYKKVDKTGILCNIIYII